MDLSPLLNDETSIIINKLLGLTQSSQSVIANNIANADTPGYIRREFDFQTELTKTINENEMNSLANIVGRVTKDEKSPAGIDGNNVLLPNEMNNMMQNTIFFKLLSKAHSTRINILRQAIGNK